MGTSTDGITFFGACWTDDGGEPYWPWSYVMVDGEHKARDDDEEPETWLAKATGFDDDEPDYPGQGRTDAERDAWLSALKVYRDKREAHLFKHGLAGLTFGAHCSDSVPMQYVAITETAITAWRGYPKRCEQPAEGSDWRARLRRLADVTGIDIAEDGIGWWLTSWWG